MRTYLLTLVATALSWNVLVAQDAEISEAEKDTTYWQSSFSAGLNFNQAGFSNNWKAGGVNSVAFGSLVAGKASYEKEKFSWNNELELLFGIVRNEGEQTRKSNDRIFLDSKLGYKVAKNWSAYFSANYLSQFAEGYTYNDDGSKSLISKFMAPGFLTSSLGLEYQPNETFLYELALSHRGLHSLQMLR